jgi:hypothetical protein
MTARSDSLTDAMKASCHRLLRRLKLKLDRSAHHVTQPVDEGSGAVSLSGPAVGQDFLETGSPLRNAQEKVSGVIAEPAQDRVEVGYQIQNPAELTREPLLHADHASR